MTILFQPRAMQVPFVSILKSNDYPIEGEAGDHVIHDLNTYNQFFGGQPPTRLPIDFRTQEAIIVSRVEPTSGCEIEIQNVTAFEGLDDKSTVLVNYTRRGPSECAAEVMTSPIHVIRVPRMNPKHLFVETVSHRNLAIQSSARGEVPIQIPSAGGEVPVPFSQAATSLLAEIRPILDLSHSVPFTTYAGGPVGGPMTAKNELIYSVEDYLRWLGDIDPEFLSAHKHLEGVDFSREMLIAISLGEVPLGTTLAVSSIELITGGVMGGHGNVNCSIHRPTGFVPEMTAFPYTVIKCPQFSGYKMGFPMR